MLHHLFYIPMCLSTIPDRIIITYFDINKFWLFFLPVIALWYGKRFPFKMQISPIVVFNEESKQVFDFLSTNDVVVLFSLFSRFDLHIFYHLHDTLRMRAFGFTPHLIELFRYDFFFLRLCTTCVYYVMQVSLWQTRYRHTYRTMLRFDAIQISLFSFSFVHSAASLPAFLFIIHQL